MVVIVRHVHRVPGSRVVVRDLAVHPFDQVVRVAEVEADGVERRQPEFVWVGERQPGRDCPLVGLLRVRRQRREDIQEQLCRTARVIRREVRRPRRNVERSARQQAGEVVVEQDARVGAVLDLRQRAAERTAHRHRPRVLARVGLGHLRDHQRAERVSHEEDPARLPVLRREDLPKLVGALHPVRQRPPVARVAGGGDGVSRREQRVTRRAVTVLCRRRGNRQTGLDDSMRIQHEVPVPEVGNVDRVGRPRSDGTFEVRLRRRRQADAEHDERDDDDARQEKTPRDSRCHGALLVVTDSPVDDTRCRGLTERQREVTEADLRQVAGSTADPSTVYFSETWLSGRKYLRPQNHVTRFWLVRL